MIFQGGGGGPLGADPENIILGGGGGGPDSCFVFVINVFHKENSFTRGSVPVFLRQTIATCDFQGVCVCGVGGSGPHAPLRNRA